MKSARDKTREYSPRIKNPILTSDDKFLTTNNSSLSLLNSRSFRSTNDLPEAKSPYNSLTNSVRKIVPHEMACKLGCKGKKCKYCNSNWSKEDMAIDGLYSHWITDDILAMARPRDALVKEQKLIHKMKKAGIKSIFNLQTRNEHKDCGEGILKETGFSYDPNDFTSNHVYYYNYELEDFSIGSIAKLLDMVKVFDFALTEGKVAVHCHAGLGRTGLLIACYLIFSFRMTSNQAIHFVREKRSNSVQMTEQIRAVKDFEKFLRPFRIVYYEPYDHLIDSLNLESGDFENSSSTFSLHTFLIRQKHILHGYERKLLKYIPKIIYVCGEQIKHLIDRWKLSEQIPRNLKHSKDYEKYENKNSLEFIAEALSYSSFSKKLMTKVEFYQSLINDTNDGYEQLSNEEDPFVLSILIWSWIDHLKEPILRDQEINMLLRGYSNSSSHFDYVNWKDLDKGTLHTINYLMSIINELMPLNSEILDRLIDHMIACLTQTKLKANAKSTDLESYNNDFDTISFLNSDKKLKKHNFLILKALFKELIYNPVEITEKSLGKSKFRKENHSEYNHNYNDDSNSFNESRNESKRSSKQYFY